MDKVFHFSFAYVVRPEISISVEFLCCPVSDPKGRTIRKLMGVGGGGEGVGRNTKKIFAQGKIK